MPLLKSNQIGWILKQPGFIFSVIHLSVLENDIGLINIPVNHKKILVVFPKKKCDGACAQVRM